MKYLKFVLLVVVGLVVIGSTATAGTKSGGWTYVAELELDTLNTDSSWLIDTIGVTSFLLPNGYVRAFKARCIVEPSPVVLRGIGLLDTCTLTLKSTFAGQWNTIGTSNRGELPCTLYVNYGPDTTGGGVDLDTLFQEDLLLIFSIGDSTSDSTFAAPYNIKINYLLKY